jgi:hypothetical protein
LSAATFASFQSQINGVHGGVHVRTGGDMGSVPSAGYDPIFYLHHANVDRLWAQWQAAHPGALPASEATFALAPFNRPFSTAWQQGSDVESTDALDYRYRRFCFYFPPIRLWEAVRIQWPLPLREQMISARLVLKSGQMQSEPLEIRAFVDQPDATASTKTSGNTAFAGVVGFMGHAAVKRPAAIAITRQDVLAVHAGAAAMAGGGPVAAGPAIAVADVLRAAGNVVHMHDGHTHGDQEHEHGGGQGGNAPEPSSGADRFDVELDLTAALRRVPREANDVALKLVAINAAGEQLPASSVPFEEIELVVD